MEVAAVVQKNLSDAVRQSLLNAVAAGELSIAAVPEKIELEKPREKAHGDFACTISMMLAKEAKLPPRKIAEAIVKFFPADCVDLEKIEIAGPGFINLYLKRDWLYRVLKDAVRQGDDYGKSDYGNNTKIQVEFVSANPTGPLHMGNARGAGIGSVLANVLEWAGYDVEREFYINDAGNQIENFGKSLEARYLELHGQEVEFPEDGYHGNDIIELMQALKDEVGDKYLSWEPEKRRACFIEYSLQKKIRAMREDLTKFGVEYDVWFSENSLHEAGKVLEIIDELDARGAIENKDGAKWLKLVDYGEEKNEVLIRGNGIPTYFAADIAYHKNKFERGFQTVINIWGADHHGHVSRMKSAMAAVGYDSARLEVVIMQLVRLLRDGEQVRMSKRAGEMVTLSDLIEEVGVDAARYFFVMRSPDSHLDFDLNLAKSKSNENPVYYIQYAYARICSIFRQVEERSIILQPINDIDFSVLVNEFELELLKKVGEMPEEVVMAAVGREPHRMARYAHELAGLFHAFYNGCRCIGEEEKIMQARIALAGAVKISLCNSLRILGISAPEQM